MLGTQFEATDARRLFPCWDEPSFRARFQLTAVVPENWLAISNMPVENETKVDPAERSSLCHDSADGELPECFRRGRARSSIRKQRNDVNPGDRDQRQSGDGHVTRSKARQILEYYNDYFGGTVSAAEARSDRGPRRLRRRDGKLGRHHLLRIGAAVRSGKSSDKTKQNIFEVIAHETAHMWFGDLVTMAWWDNLWLNEGFASWMGTKCTAHFNPQWEVWLRKISRAIRPGASASPRNRPWKAMQDRQLIPSSNRSRPKPKRTAPSTTSLTKKASRSSACSKVFSAKMFFATAFANTSPRTNIPTRRPPIFGTRSGSIGQTGRGNRGGLDGATGISDRESDTRRRRQSFAHAGEIHGEFQECAAAAMENPAHLFCRRTANAEEFVDDGEDRQSPGYPGRSRGEG